MAKLDIDFVLIDESVVDYGYRVLMSGLELEDFKQNPVMLYLHLRGNDGWEKPTDNILLPIGRWYDIRVEGTRLLAKPEFDDDDDFAKRIENKVKKGYLNAASVWIAPITVSDDETLRIAGQSGPTVTRSGIKESSIVDIPGCRNAIAIRNSAGKKLLLSSNDKTSQPEVLEYLNSFLTQSNNSEMDKKLLAVKLGLPETATEAEIDAKLSATISAATPNVTLSTENTTLKKKLEDLENAKAEEQRVSLVDGAIAAKKLTAKQRDQYLKLAAADFETTKAAIDGMPTYKSIESMNLGGKEKNAAEVAELMKLSGRDLWLQGKLSKLKELDMESFKTKYKEAHGVEYKEKA